MAGNSNVVNANPTLPPRRANSTEVVGKWTQIVRLPVTQPQEKSYELPTSQRTEGRLNLNFQAHLHLYGGAFLNP